MGFFSLSIGQEEEWNEKKNGWRLSSSSSSSDRIIIVKCVKTKSPHAHSKSSRSSNKNLNAPWNYRLFNENRLRSHQSISNFQRIHLSTFVQMMRVPVSLQTTTKYSLRRLIDRSADIHYEIYDRFVDTFIICDAKWKQKQQQKFTAIRSIIYFI